MSRTNDRRESRFFTGDEHELQKIKSKESLQKFVKHNRTKKRFSRLTYFVLIGVLVVIFSIIILAVFFRVEEIEVVGTVRYTEEQILAVTGIERGIGLYEVSDSDFASVGGKLAYVKKIHITRRLPDTLIINVTEDEPRYVAGFYGEYFILSDELRVLERVYDRDSFAGMGLIELVLPQIDSAMVGYQVGFEADISRRYVEAYVDELESSPLYELTTAFDLRDRFNMSLIAKDIYLIDLGNGDELGTKLTAVAGMLDHQVFADAVPASIDANDPTQCTAIKNPNLIIAFDD